MAADRDAQAASSAAYIASLPQIAARRRLAAAAIALAVLTLLTGGMGSGPAAAFGGDLIPTPEFSQYEIPVSLPAAVEHPAWEWINIALLLAALALASYLALVRRSRRGLFALAIAALIWFGFVRAGCICPIGATQNVTLALFDSTYAIPAVVVGLFVLPLVFTLFFGRTFCGAVCPLGAIQEVVVVRPVRVPNWLEHGLRLIPYIYLGMALIYAATGTAFLICRYDPFVAMFRLSGDVYMLVFGGALLLLGVFVGRPYCRYLCPYGAVLALFSKGAKWHASITPSKCIRCRLCEDSCPYGAIQAPTAPLSVHSRPAARRRLAVVLALAPLLIVSGGLLGRLLALPLARLDPVDRLAERVRQEDLGQVVGTTDASEAFRNTGSPAAELFAQATGIRDRFGMLGVLLGGWVGLVVAVKLITVSVRRKREDYQTDQARCVSCGRCYWYCPEEQLRLGNIRDVSEMVDLETLEATRP